ncbi:MAG: hypothetical protein PHV49_01470, partial [Alistipes sp.]|nr:hypothetical protein [Alistipes sp.]
MKKIFIVALMGLLGLTSCLGDGSKGDPTITGYSIYMDVNRQNVLALDPTNIAFRLNTLICEGKGDIQSVPDNIRRKLFSSGTTITYDEAKGSYDLVFNGSTITGDFARKGTVSVVTNGFDSLGMVGAQWGVLIS